MAIFHSKLFPRGFAALGAAATPLAALDQPGAISIV
jgi:hypothetical protein